MTRARQSLARWAAAVRAWPIWKEPNWLVGLVILVVAADLAVLGASAAVVRFSVYDLILFGLLLCGVAVTVELTRQAGHRKGLVKDVYGAWNLPAGDPAAAGLRAGHDRHVLRSSSGGSGRSRYTTVRTALRRRVCPL